jgi:hypothetical protein
LQAAVQRADSLFLRDPSRGVERTGEGWSLHLAGSEMHMLRH